MSGANRHDPALVEREASAIRHIRECAQGLLKSLREVEARGDLYDMATHRWADLLEDALDDPDSAQPAIAAAQPAPVADLDALAGAVQRAWALGERWAGFDDSHHYGDTLLRVLGDPPTDAAEVRAQERRKVAEEIAWLTRALRETLLAGDNWTKGYVRALEHIEAELARAYIAREHAASDREASDG